MGGPLFAPDKPDAQRAPRTISLFRFFCSSCEMAPEGAVLAFSTAMLGCAAVPRVPITRATGVAMIIDAGTQRKS